MNCVINKEIVLLMKRQAEREEKRGIELSE